MKVDVSIVEDSSLEKATILVAKMTDEIKQAINLLSEGKSSITGYKDNNAFLLDINKIYYIEAVDNKTFLVFKESTYECKLKLYELEEMLDKNKFFRCSKSMIVNVKKIHHVKSSLNGRIDATLLNDELVVISRSYSKDLKAMLGM